MISTTPLSSCWDDPVNNFSISQDVKSNFMKAFALADNTVDHVMEAGSRAAVASIVNGEIASATKAEAVDNCGTKSGTRINHGGQ